LDKDKLNDEDWLQILKQKTYHRIKINGEIIVLKKIISKTDLNLKSCCIQSKIREKLKISSLDTREFYLLDRDSKEFGRIKFPKDGRLDGTAFWIKLYDGILKPGDFILLSKIEEIDKVIIVIDHFKNYSSIINSLKDLYDFCIGLKYKLTEIVSFN
jgi:hypothetical protein